ncbi:MAG: cytochrome c biogenesis protein CcdA, partial [Paraeggerthella sp.]|nr:cytochrome c biogenesis protein CcdA [Paraeggerthella sp.]
MGFSLETSIPALTVFVQGLLSFFSPCVLPLIPLYVGYLAGGAGKVGEDGLIEYPRKKVFVNTLFFVVGVSFAFFLLGFGFTALGQFFTGNQRVFSMVAGIIMVAFGLYMLGAFGKTRLIESERRLPFNLGSFAMNPLVALVLGFTFSFAWTPCVGPVLAGVLLMASSSASAAWGYVLVAVYTLGFVLPFLMVGLFTGEVLRFFRTHGNVVKYTVKVGGALLIVM